MGAMEDMVGNILKKMVPPEIMAMLTPEKAKEISDKIGALWIVHKEQMDRIEQAVQSHATLLARIGTNLEELNNERGNDDGNSGSPARGKPARNRRKSAGSS